MRHEDAVKHSDYWNHNPAYHPWIMKLIGLHSKMILDVGCGEGLLVQRLASQAQYVIGVDPDENSIQRAKRRLLGVPNVTFENKDFLEYTAIPGTFDAIIFVASIHHLDGKSAFNKAKELLAPDGLLLVVGCAKSKTLTDWVIEIGRTPFAWIGTKIHGETNPGVPTKEPALSLDEIKSIAKDILPGANIRRGLYYRYLLAWRNPKQA